MLQKYSIIVLCCSAVLARVPVAKNCPTGWTWFLRSRGGWCMKVFTEALNQPSAEAKCKAAEAVLAGIQNKEEVAWMSKELTGTMWIGTKRTPPCMNSGVTKQCSQITSYYWTDGSTVGVQGFYWNSGEPNNQGGQGCAKLITSSSVLDDVACTTELTNGYVCGKIATF
ncbi:C-type lectin domain-containing protein [Caenorhabditis elegans]|uniref:C-type lectin domain-containing protein n=1 Tax=Caenorhabditis elegans TaxID=6239 RepID=O16641_CAEEL|nr:C-type lectin domain-containing protein [Caenorhabditis elegans]CCD73658.1 C-type lectin domain-containing protein [Caenorhabditis elegans]|eukprot:NP_494567.1 C-type LECtin [Caenorhabditis elegans]